MADAINGQVQVAQGRAMNPIDAVMQSRAVSHFGKLIGLAAAVAIGTVVVLWTAEPNYAPLYSNMSGRDSAQVADSLLARNIDFKIDASGNLMVDQAKLAEARMLLASQGLPANTGQIGLEMLQQEQGLGTSQFIETARYNHALESELVRSVESIRSVESARVHLALPEQSIFIRNRVKPSASVVVKLHPGRTLNAGQVEAIVQLIASSVPMLEGSEVNVVDQFGRLLTQNEDEGMAQTSRQYQFQRELEDNLSDRIIQLLQPIIGPGRVNAQVSAQLDFSAVETTREAFDPERSVVRSEQINEEEMRDILEAAGVPGALSNQPPGAGTTEPQPDETADISGIPANQSRSSIRNYEVDRVISHTSNPVGTIQRLSVAVVIDDKVVPGANRNAEKTPYTDEEIARFVELVRETIGFDQNRGDSVSVINASFLQIEEQPIEELPIWQSLLGETWLINLSKQVLGALGLLIVYLVFLRPFLRSLALNRVETSGSSAAAGSLAAQGGAMMADGSMSAAGAPGSPGAMDYGTPNLVDDPNNPAAMVRRSNASYEQKLDMARSLVVEDPARVANVMKTWVNEA